MGAVVVKVDASRVTVSLQNFVLSLSAKEQLLRNIGLLMMGSVRQTFRDQGSPSGSWPPLSAASRSWRKYSSGHKLLINTGLLLNSINFAAQGNSVVIGTNLSYAGVHQFGFDGTQSVKPYAYVRRQQSRDQFRKVAITDKRGRSRRVTRKVSSGIATVSVRAFSRHIHIPARPFLVFRPEDPARIQSATEIWAKHAARQSGLEAS
jgi:phage virion morphogenesis protein